MRRNGNEGLPPGVYHISEVVAELLATLPKPVDEESPLTAEMEPTGRAIFTTRKETNSHD